jgi:hypothetical protein
VAVASVLSLGQVAAFETMFDPEWWLADDLSMFGAGYLVAVVLTLVSYVMLFLVFFSYTMLYEERGPGPFTPGEVWQQMRQYAGPYLTTLLWIGLLIVPLSMLNVILCLGTLAFIALLAWLLPIWSLVFPRGSTVGRDSGRRSDAAAS